MGHRADQNMETPHTDNHMPSGPKDEITIRNWQHANQERKQNIHLSAKFTFCLRAKMILLIFENKLQGLKETEV